MTTETTEKQALRSSLLKIAATVPTVEKKAQAAKRAWKKAHEAVKQEKLTLQKAEAEARRKMDHLYGLLADATNARNRLRAEFTPKKLQHAERDAGYAHRVLKLKREKAEGELRQTKHSMKLRERRKGFTPPDRETRQREADRIVYMESQIAKFSDQEQSALEEWRKAQKELEDAYGSSEAEAEATDNTADA